MANLTIKGVPDKLLERLKESAVRHRRGLDSEAISCLEMVLAGNRVDPRLFLEQVRSLRARMPRLHITNRELRAARNKGRA